jgi:hypothetical protein
LGLNKSGLQEQAFDLRRYVVIAVFGKDGTVISVRYLTRDHDASNDSMVQKLLFQNAGTLEPGVDFSGARENRQRMARWGMKLTKVSTSKSLL